MLKPTIYNPEMIACIGIFSLGAATVPAWAICGGAFIAL